jgi:hypothetical protein
MTALEVFNRAIKMMDEQSDSGETKWGDTQEYQVRSVEILNLLINECYPYSDTFEIPTPGKRPVCVPILTLDEEVNLDDGIAGTVLPYGLAAELAKNDDPVLGNYFLQRYQELLARFGRNLPAAWDTIDDVYGVVDPVSFGRW